MKLRTILTEVDNGFVVEDEGGDEVMVFQDFEELANFMTARFYEHPLGRNPADFRVEFVDIRADEYADTVIVTRHKALVKLLQERCWLSPNTPVLEHATEEDVKGKHVIGVLPLRLAALARTITEVTLDIPAEMRGQELTEEQLREYYKGINVYKVKEVVD